MRHHRQLLLLATHHFYRITIFCFLNMKQLESEGAEVIDLTSDEREVFIETISPILSEARSRLGETLFSMLGKS